MKRTGEVALGIIGAVIYGFFTLIGGFMIWIENNKDTVRDFFDEMAKEDPDLAMSSNDLNEALAVIGNNGWLVFIVALLAIILGIVAMVFLKGNKKPKPAGIILIVTPIVAALLISFGTLWAGVFYIIAGIMSLARKPQTMLEE